ncbi:carbohydrate ABC transporter permease [Spirochaeta cellobiosiphila]|uniref:carbohydrate ABC transporter permease n=1 Tax=Spirochaeta cellobiosiphila TaxID=504483 RepID=UPI000424A539|nr:carbohydrate ABC transporter permease [Spirochaeta cellobiosiphila]
MRASGKKKKKEGLVAALTFKQTKEDIIFNVITTVFVILGCFVIIYPIYFILIASISNPDYVLSGQIIFWPKDISLGGYERIFNYSPIWVGYRNSILYSLFGAIISGAITLFVAYPISRQNFSGRKFITIFILITMFFQGGLIPTYILVKSLHLRNTPFVLLFVNGINVMNVFIASSYFKSSNIESLYEAAQIDGCTHFGYFFKILLPISTPIVVVMLLFYGVWQWNDFFRAMIYIDKDSIQPLQTVLKDLLAINKVSNDTSELVSDYKAIEDMIRAAESMKYGIIIMATVPMLILYLLLQKYFEQGITMGSVKG